MKVLLVIFSVDHDKDIEVVVDNSFIDRIKIGEEESTGHVPRPILV